MSVVYCVGSGLCDELVTLLDESYRVFVSVCDLETSKRGSLSSSWAVVTQKNFVLLIY
jgi:hypothetical protein